MDIILKIMNVVNVQMKIRKLVSMKLIHYHVKMDILFMNMGCFNFLAVMNNAAINIHI